MFGRTSPGNFPTTTWQIDGRSGGGAVYFKNTSFRTPEKILD
jgi:hypothetical protein